MIGRSNDNEAVAFGLARRATGAVPRVCGWLFGLPTSQLRQDLSFVAFFLSNTQTTTSP